jgi:ferredoxin-nitrite reductase
MTQLEPNPTTASSAGAFTLQQKEYLAGFLAGIAQRRLVPYAGTTPAGTITDLPDQGGPNLAAAPPEETVYGTRLSDLCKQELWKHELHGLDAWDRLLEHAEQNKFPDEADNFRFRYHGLFYVGPVQDSFMLRCRIPAGELSAGQFRGLAEISDQWGDGRAAITTRANLQIRQIAPKHLVQVLTQLVSLGLTSRGSGVDNVRNITASPTAGLDLQELLDTRPFAHGLHHYILNQRDLYDLPRKFNVAFEGGGSVDTLADTNDIGFMAVRVRGSHAADGTAHPVQARALSDQSPVAVEPGVYFRVQLAGITGHKQFAHDTGLLVKPQQAVAVAAAMIRVFIEHGDRTDRKKARLKYLLDSWGFEKFLRATQEKLAFPLLTLPLEQCEPRREALRHGHIGVYRQKQPGRNYIGVVVPVGILSTRQMRRLADIARDYGTGQLRLTPWQNLLLPDIPDGFVETVKRQLVRIGLHYHASNLQGGLVACTGNKGCKWSSTDTKGHALALGEYLGKRLQLDQPLNIHFTGCPNSCAQHYVGDIGLQGVKTGLGGASVEGYNIVFGGGYGKGQAVAKQVFTGIPFSAVPALLERALRVFLTRRQTGETFTEFTRRHEIKQLQEMFSE